MTATREFYLTQAEACAAEAEAATLVNVRDRALRSESAWRRMVARHDGLIEQRAVADAVRAARVAEG